MNDGRNRSNGDGGIALAPGVAVVEGPGMAAGLETVLAAVRQPQTRVYVVDTFWKPELKNSWDILKTLLDSIAAAEWYGYEFAASMAHCVETSPQMAHVAVIALSHRLAPLLGDWHFIEQLSAVHIAAMRRHKLFHSYIFLGPLADAVPRI